MFLVSTYYLLVLDMYYSAVLCDLNTCSIHWLQQKQSLTKQYANDTQRNTPSTRIAKYIYDTCVIRMSYANSASVCDTKVIRRQYEGNTPEIRAAHRMGHWHDIAVLCPRPTKLTRIALLPPAELARLLLHRKSPPQPERREVFEGGALSAGHTGASIGILH